MSATGHTLQQLETEPILAHQRREWIVERLGWCTMAAMLAVGLVGGLGPAPLTWHDAASSDGSLRVSYYFVERAAAPTQLEIAWHPPAKAEKVELLISRAFNDHTTLESIVPEPVSQTLRDEHIAYAFALSNATEIHKVVLRYKHEQMGPLAYEVALAGQEPAHIQQFVMP